MQNSMPFEVSKTESFYDKLGEWIGDVFYDILPDAGYELRDEQVFMAYQLEKAFKDKKTIFAEAGVGTGKTFVYLLYSICYARYVNKPAIIACSDETLIEQLVKKEGDIAKLEQALGLNIDVRLAKSRNQYLCLTKLDQKITFEDTYNSIYDSLPEFVHGTGSMQSFAPYGDRKDYPDLNDNDWEGVAWDSMQDCFTCDKRHRCGQTLHRDYYRNAKDLIICSHDFYMEHIWTKESRKREGQLPLLPDSACVVFDEGHLLEYAAQNALTYRLTEQNLENLLTRLMANDVREKTLNLIEETIYQNEQFFRELTDASFKAEGSDKQEIKKTENVMRAGRKLAGYISDLEEELVFESEMYVINEYDLKVVEEYLEQISHSLGLFLKEMNGITWFEETNSERTLVIMPRLVQDIMQEEVFRQKKPIVFSSATLSENKSFDYMAKSIGASNYLSFSVDSPFDYEENMTVHINSFENEATAEKQSYCYEEINKANGRSLILFNSKEDLASFKENLPNDFSLPIYFEGEREISTLVSKFQNEEESILCAVNLWEGLDVPGRSLENVFIYSLPFPPNDPVYKSKRENVENPFLEVDLPYMILRLRQGIGRLIRTHEDKGSIHLCMNTDEIELVKNAVLQALPVEPN
ncbi:ATP-dependent DNA helicase [Niallia sp. FSL W8-0635]|uniref:ATP-dependent DNA helicase n=1 Tax=Niallia sp. FSL W8-0635 TaxID=2975337 RepID=UPI0009CD4865|nr:ATP-dependent helicase DinG [Mycobacteroides abscessus subsp. abscessus]HEO8421271.1 ATP-dependent DNA helicase [Yersinia enterocolitica]